MFRVDIKIISSRMASLQAGLALSRSVESTGESDELDRRLLREIGTGTRNLSLLWENNQSPVDDVLGRARNPGLPFYATILEESREGGRSVEGRIEVTISEVRGPGRPPTGEAKVMIQVRIPQDLKALLLDAAQQEQATETEIVTRALRAYLD